MSPPAVTPQKTSRRSRRPHKQSVGASPSHVSSSQDADFSADTEPDKQVKLPTRILRRGEADSSLDIPPFTNVDAPSPQTSRRSVSSYDGSSNQQQHCNGSPHDVTQNSKKTAKTQKRKQSGPITPAPTINGTPISVPRRESAISTASNITPTKAYAGPTFHASPAASSLPMPKFYSKSVPNEKKPETLGLVLDQEVPDSSSGGEESPSLENIKPVLSSATREESPLDIFFRADREAKRRTGSAPNIPSRKSFQSNPSTLGPSPHALSQSRSRPTSVGGVFSLEMDGMSSEMFSGAVTPEISPNKSKHVPSVDSNPAQLTQDDSEEQRKAQTAALKKLLYSPRPQNTQNVSAGQRPPSSKLRKELSMPTSPEVPDAPELPATPTPFRRQNVSTSPTNGFKASPSGHNSPFHPSRHSGDSSQSQRATLTPDTTNTTSIENDLRRILKLDMLGSDGFTGH